MDIKTVLFIGPQGSGKGTQAERLEEYLKEEGPVLHYTSGDRFRSLDKEGGYTSELIHESLTQGNVQPLFLSVSLWGSCLINKLTPESHLIIDGVPRRTTEAELLHSALDFYKREHRCVVSLLLDDEIAIDRMLKRGREDDTEEGIKRRLSWYHEKTQPIIDFYKDHKDYTFIEVDASRDVDTIQSEIRSQIT